MEVTLNSGVEWRGSGPGPKFHAGMKSRPNKKNMRQAELKSYPPPLRKVVYDGFLIEIGDDWSYTNAEFVYEKIHSYTKFWISYTIDRLVSRRSIVYDGRDDISSIRNIVSQNFVLRNFPSYTKSNLSSEFVYEITFWRRNSSGIRLKSISAIDDDSSPFWSGGPGFRLQMMIWIRWIV